MRALIAIIVLGFTVAAYAQVALGPNVGTNYVGTPVPLGPLAPGSSGPPPVSCASTGIFDLSNVCNDIYFIGALK